MNWWDWAVVGIVGFACFIAGKAWVKTRQKELRTRFSIGPCGGREGWAVYYTKDGLLVFADGTPVPLTQLENPRHPNRIAGENPPAPLRMRPDPTKLCRPPDSDLLRNPIDNDVICRGCSALYGSRHSPNCHVYLAKLRSVPTPPPPPPNEFKG